jgi:hypothetical protein
MVEELLGFEKKKAVYHEPAKGFEDDGVTLLISQKDCFPVVEKKEHDNKVEDMRNTIELNKGLKTAFEKKAKELEQQLAEKEKENIGLKQFLELNDKEITKMKNTEEQKDRQIETLRKIDIDGDGLIFENNKLEEKLKERENEIIEKIKQIAELKATTETKERTIKRLCGKKDKYTDYLGNAIKKPEKKGILMNTNESKISNKTKPEKEDSD